MAFKPADLPRTTRRIEGSARRRLHPRLLRDDRFLPRLGTAVRLFETWLGQRRCEIDEAALMHLFDEPRLARCLVACLARSYRYRARPLAEVVGAETAARLAADGLGSPIALRARAYERANQQTGYVSTGRRAAFLDALVPDLDAVTLESALWLDAPDQAVLRRVGPTPTSADLAALYNLRVVETLLRSASVAHLERRGSRATIEAVCARHGVRAEVDGRWASLHGEQDAMGGWQRQGARLARAALTLLTAGDLGPGEATIWLGEAAHEARLDAPLLRAALPGRGWSAPAATWPALDALLADLVGLRRQGGLAGWRLRRWPEPLVGPTAAIWPELLLSRGDRTIPLLPLTAADLATAGDDLLTLAQRHGLVILAPTPLPYAPDGLTVLPLDGPEAAAALVAHVDGEAGAAEAVPTWLPDLTSQARAAGAVAESALAERLVCDEADLGERLAALLRAAPDLTYVEGFGLCAADLLQRARAVLDEETARAGRLDLRATGRALRLLTGRNDGLHALIAHLTEMDG